MRKLLLRNVSLNDACLMVEMPLFGVDIEYTMFNSNMIGVILTGTAVKIEKIEEIKRKRLTGEKAYSVLPLALRSFMNGR